MVAIPNSMSECGYCNFPCEKTVGGEPFYVVLISESKFSVGGLRQASRIPSSFSLYAASKPTTRFTNFKLV